MFYNGRFIPDFLRITGVIDDVPGSGKKRILVLKNDEVFGTYSDMTNAARATGLHFKTVKKHVLDRVPVKNFTFYEVDNV